ncbi:MAG: Putative NAD(P)-dependent oxidoreductase EC-YbbO [uncultured Sulfurovum sp.]|uniref:NAD(P)-dependent oxidoreductase EC-YbbO n=1 Tax=uncultured Sulfurovum sp. TaxID=269237 RepID=A0A6S6TTC3_9BACT|nr:MAG: Putative NAD(P)-dependent oxidoreductase EC-YbbO [uncultured Sulfurovum sp.]
MTNIIITGCSSGIGLETAKYLKERFISVYPTSRNLEDVEMLKALGFDNAMLLDVRDATHIERVIQTVMQKEKKIDVWFNNAGYGQPGMIEDIPTNVLQEQFETNVFGLHECTRQILPIMKAQGYGKIIQHSSVLGLISLAGRGAYNASKYAIEGLTDTLRIELQGTSIYPVLLNTGPISSDFRKNALEKLQNNIDIENSDYKENYIKSLHAKKSNVPFNLEADAVAQVVYSIIAAKKPKPRYYITKATYILGYLKRVLSTTLLDKILFKIG